ncbi:hypothetical protein GLAREA_09442 [Glarea lozoyensis ATCC 20868]|uniref:Uncharacterized protein n=1 Tax=Glarea lozoyensis (strain ATCC 20868 / MF5171) TaxID=1116229 RepID=S3CPE4_GLAL2|nr:uncharacterized protein GLAREA_09442 [Glarea lozoyensis ATCC 20868]EPE28322.1 hypothetical protein GLAREA_09442 [Glarea lozoyensis ATCC 20868]
MINPYCYLDDLYINVFKTFHNAVDNVKLKVYEKTKDEIRGEVLEMKDTLEDLIEGMAKFIRREDDREKYEEVEKKDYDGYRNRLDEHIKCLTDLRREMEECRELRYENYWKLTDEEQTRFRSMPEDIDLIKSRINDLQRVETKLSSVHWDKVTAERRSGSRSWLDKFLGEDSSAKKEEEKKKWFEEPEADDFS